MQQINLNSGEFGEMLKCLSILKDICQDADIREGIIRQRTNDKSCIFEIDMTSVVQNLTMSLSNLKQKIDLLKIFYEQDVTITVYEPSDSHASNGHFTFNDQFTTLSFDGPDLDFLDNKYLTSEELEAIFPLTEESVILNTNINTTISERLRIIAQSFNVNNVIVKFDGETASILTATQGKDQTAKLIDGIVTNRQLICTSSLVITPFVIDHDDDIEMKMYNYQNDICANQFKTAIKDIKITVYGRSSLIENEE